MINGSAYAATTNDEITAGKSAIWTPDTDANGTLNAFTIVAQDDSGDNSTPAVQATVSVTAVNDVPSFTIGANQMINEDAAQILTFNVTNDDNTLFSVQPSIDEATGNLTYTPASNATGSTTVTVSLSDNGGTANGGVDTSSDQTFTITINGVNDQPSFTVGANQMINEDAGAQTASAFVSSIEDGDSEATNINL